MMTNEEIANVLAEARAMNTALPQYLDGEHVNWNWVDTHVNRLAKLMYRQEDHWHSVDGACQKEVPFEIGMQALALLSATWVSDIYLRKARDRSAPRMRTRWEEFWVNLFTAIQHVDRNVRAERDPDAEAQYRTKTRKPNPIKHRFNKLRWGH